MRKLAGAMTAFLLVGFSIIVAHAQQLPVIQTDRASVTIFTPQHPSGSFVFSGPDAQIIGDLLAGDANLDPSCGPVCAAGETITVNSQFASQTRVRVEVDGAVAFLWLEYHMFVRSQPIILPRRYSRAPFYFSIPATMTGLIRAYDRNPISSSAVPLFESPLNFEGTVTLRLKFVAFGWTGDPQVAGHPHYMLQRTDWNFQRIETSTE